MANAIEVEIGKAKKKPSFLGGDESAPDMSDEEDADEGASKEEVAAARAFRNAGSDEEAAAALKTFVKLCGGY